MNIKSLEAHDLDALLALYEHLHESDTPRPARSRVEQVWHQALANPDIRYFGNFVEGKLVSACTVTVIPNLTRSCRPYAVIENVVTQRELRGRGHGKAVLQAALDFAWGRDCYKVMLMTSRLDPAVFGFYESAGFRRDRKQAFVAERSQPEQ